MKIDSHRTFLQPSSLCLIALISVAFFSTNILFQSNASGQQIGKSVGNASISNHTSASSPPSLTEPNALMTSTMDVTRNTNATSIAAKNIIAATPKHNTLSPTAVNNTTAPTAVNNTTAPTAVNNTSLAMRSVIDQTRNTNATNIGTQHIVNSTSYVNKTSANTSKIPK
jgi:hypothetical protein